MLWKSALKLMNWEAESSADCSPFCTTDTMKWNVVLVRTSEHRRIKLPWMGFDPQALPIQLSRFPEVHRESVTSVAQLAEHWDSNPTICSLNRIQGNLNLCATSCKLRYVSFHHPSHWLWMKVETTLWTTMTREETTAACRILVVCALLCPTWKHLA
jgi:hypothetical protein